MRNRTEFSLADAQKPKVKGVLIYPTCAEFGWYRICVAAVLSHPQDNDHFRADDVLLPA